MLKTTKQSQLIDENRPQGKTLGVDEALGGHLTVGVKDALELLIEVNCPWDTALWDRAGLRVQLYNYMNSGWIAWDDVSLLGPGTVTRKYYYAGGTRVAMQDAERGTLYYLLSDHPTLR